MEILRKWGIIVETIAYFCVDAFEIQNRVLLVASSDGSFIHV